MYRVITADDPSLRFRSSDEKFFKNKKKAIEYFNKIIDKNRKYYENKNLIIVEEDRHDLSSIRKEYTVFYGHKIVTNVIFTVLLEEFSFSDDLI